MNNKIIGINKNNSDFGEFDIIMIKDEITNLISIDVLKNKKTSIISTWVKTG